MMRSLVVNKIGFDNLLFILIVLRGVAQLIKNFEFLVLGISGIIMGLLFFYFIIFSQFPRISFILFPYCLFASYGILEFWFNGINMKGVSDFLSYLLYFFFAVYFINQGEIRRKNRINFFLIVFFFVLFIQLGMSVLRGEIVRSFLGSILGHANSANLFLGFISVYLAIKREWIYSLAIFFIMVLLGGRTSLISSCVVLFSIFWIQRFQFSKFIRNQFRAFLFVGILFFIYLIYKGITVDYHEYIKIPFLGESGRLFSLDSMKWRVVHWSHYLENINDFNFFLFGSGLGKHVEVSIPIYGKFYEVHNDFLKIFYDFGIIGLVLFLWADLSIGKYFIFKNKGSWTLISFLYYIRYSYMFFDNMVTNFLSIFVFVYFLNVFSKKENIPVYFFRN